MSTLHQPASEFVTGTNKSASKGKPSWWDGPTNSGKNKSYDIRERPAPYRWLDYWLSKWHVRYCPEECGPSHLDEAVFKNDGEDKWALAAYHEALELVRHDDALNWQKFNNMVVLNAGLVTAVGFCLQSPFRLMAIGFCLFGAMSSYFFDRTFHEGMRCLRGHRKRVKALESRVTGNRTGFMLDGNPWNQRDALEVGALVLCVAWLFFAAAVTIQMLLHRWA